MTDREETIAAIAARHGVSTAAAQALEEALARGGGRMAQFSHPDLGGMGQWSAGGMIQIGDMFNDALKARVAALAVELSGMAPRRPEAVGEAGGGRAWWPRELGAPSSSGGQNGLRYAYFAGADRLAIDRGDGRVETYDTAGARISGVAQQQGTAQTLRFSGPDGEVELGKLRKLS